tara:strand:- start:7512 stop:7703 length:192 start_codon:yes stop_codon:yes gene_type:complete
MDDDNTTSRPFDFSKAMPRSWTKKEEENKKVNKMAYFFSFLIWIPIIVTVCKFWWDFGLWLFR